MYKDAAVAQNSFDSWARGICHLEKVVNANAQ